MVGKFALISLAPLLFGQVSLAETRAPLPEAPEKELIEQHCVRCHSIEWIEQAEGSESEWTMRVRRMIRRGSELPQERIGPLAAYLADALPRRVRAEAIVASPVELAISEAAFRPVQVWIRASGRSEDSGNALLADLSRSDGSLVAVGQRVRAFSLESRSSMQQGKVVRVAAGEQGASVQVELQSKLDGHPRYLLEIVVDRGQFLSVPTESIIEEDGRRIIYVQSRSGDFAPREITTGIEGELYTQVISGVAAGERVVTFGSFFIDAEYKMKGTSSPSLAITYMEGQDPARAGDNAVEVSVRSMNDEPVTDATVTVTYYMAAMPSMGMPEMRNEFTLAHRAEGTYAGTARLSMNGTWLVTVSVSRGGEILGNRKLTIFATE